MIRGSGIEGNVTKNSVGNIRDSSVYQVVVMEGNGTIRHGVVAEDAVKLR